MSSKSHVTMVSERCKVCGDLYDSNTIALATRFNSNGELVTPFDDTNTWMGDWGICPEHQEQHDDGFFFLVGVKADDTAKTGGTLKPAEADRSGEMCAIKRDLARELFDNISIDDGELMAFVDQRVIDTLHEWKASGTEKAARQEAEQEGAS